MTFTLAHVTVLLTVTTVTLTVVTVTLTAVRLTVATVWQPTSFKHARDDSQALFVNSQLFSCK